MVFLGSSYHYSPKQGLGLFELCCLFFVFFWCNASNLCHILLISLTQFLPVLLLYLCRHWIPSTTQPLLSALCGSAPSLSVPICHHCCHFHLSLWPCHFLLYSRVASYWALAQGSSSEVGSFFIGS